MQHPIKALAEGIWSSSSGTFLWCCRSKRPTNIRTFCGSRFCGIFSFLSGFDVAKTGDARIGFVGFPSVGKSTLLSNLAGVYSEVAAYEFTTLTTVPGKLVVDTCNVLLSIVVMKVYVEQGRIAPRKFFQ